MFNWFQPTKPDIKVKFKKVQNLIIIKIIINNCRVKKYYIQLI